MIVGADAHIGPFGSYEFAADYRKIGAFCRADVGIGPYNGIWKYIRIRIGLSLFAASCRDLSGALRQLPLKGEP